VVPNAGGGAGAHDSGAGADGLAATADWYRAYESGADMRDVTLRQLGELT